MSAIARAERARDGEARDSEVATRVLKRLHQGLGKPIGPAGFDVLVARSLVLARRDHALLAGVTAGPGGALTGLDDPERAGASFQAGAMAIVAHFVDLLVRLIGEDLAMRLMRDVWPAAAEEVEK